MELSPLTLIAVPLLGGLIGYLTNRLAVKMIFRPIKPINILGFRVQGLMAKRQEALAASIGTVVGAHLLRHEDVVKSFEKVDLEGLLEQVLSDALADRIEQLRGLPLIGGFLTEERLGELRRSLVEGFLGHREALLEKLEEAVEAGLDIESVVREKVAAFPVEKLESLILEVASRELRAIEVLGGVLGMLIGLLQLLAIWAFG